VPVDYLGTMTFSDHGKKLDVTYRRQVLTCSDQQRFVAIHLRRDGQNKRVDDPATYTVLTDGANRYYALGVRFGSYEASSTSPYYGFFAYKSGGQTFPIGDDFDPKQYKGVTIAAENPTTSTDEYVLFKVPSTLRQCKYADHMTTSDITFEDRTAVSPGRHESRQNAVAPASAPPQPSSTLTISAGWLTDEERQILVSVLSSLAFPPESITVDPIYEKTESNFMAAGSNASPPTVEVAPASSGSLDFKPMSAHTEMSLATKVSLAAKWGPRLGDEPKPSEIAVYIESGKPDAQVRLFRVDAQQKVVREFTPNRVPHAWKIEAQGVIRELPPDVAGQSGANSALRDAENNAIRSIQDGQTIRTHDGIKVQRTGDTVTFGY